MKSEARPTTSAGGWPSEPFEASAKTRFVEGFTTRGESGRASGAFGGSALGVCCLYLDTI